MIIQCPNCGKSVPINGLGRKPLAIIVNNVYNALQRRCNVAAAAKELGCSRAYIYGVLKKNGVSIKDFVDQAEPPK